MKQLVNAADGKPRCGWCAAAPEFFEYHDNEWGYPVKDEFRLFEKLCLESFQSGLSWRTILAKREAFREAFDGFDYRQVAKFKQRKINQLLKNEGIVRHRGKIEAVINNAQQACKLADTESSLAAYVWSFEPDTDSLDPPQTVSTSPASVALSKDLKQRGWKFVGPTTAFAFMQAMGLINDHATGCVMRDKAAHARAGFSPPSR